MIGYLLEKISNLETVISELEEENAEFCEQYFDLSCKYGELVEEKDNAILSLRSEVKRLKRENTALQAENWNLKNRRGRK